MAFSEVQALRIRQGLAGLWLVIILSLFRDPLTPALTGPDSPFPALAVGPKDCVVVQDHCIHEVSYALGAPIYWGLLLPVLIAVLFLFGHEFWRRVCPLSFFSQIARNLDWVRRRPAVSKDGKAAAAAKPAKMRPDSFVAKNHFYLQFGLFYLAVCARILFVNSSRITLACFLLAFILASVIVGFLYDGKTWCQYFCPVAPVEEFYTGPRGLFASKAHLRSNSKLKVTQSMCRTLPSDDGLEKSNCVACKSNCIDIDAEKKYWLELMEPRKQQLAYGYAGLVIGYFAYYFFYSGNWWYYFSGLWSHEADQNANLLKSGLYLAGHTLPIPKLLAVPLVIGLSIVIVYWLGVRIESTLVERLQRGPSPLTPETVRHRCLTVVTVAIFNLFFVFGGHSFLYMLPHFFHVYVPAILCGLSGLWLYRTWKRTPADYSQEVVADKRSQRKVPTGQDLNRVPVSPRSLYGPPTTSQA
jgi:hypothetical protein